jgi:hypothetical protein
MLRFEAGEIPVAAIEQRVGRLRVREAGNAELLADHHQYRRQPQPQ